MRQLIGVFDERTSREISKNTTRAMRESAKQGFWNGATRRSAANIGNKDVLQAVIAGKQNTNGNVVVCTQMARPKRGGVQQQKALYLLGNCGILPCRVMPSECTTLQGSARQRSADEANKRLI